ncbi:MAG: molybdenum cofactor guanylyltransferase [Dehalococcoidia bacterium]|jgi:molybdopterin-guanine dinucleotide biosynthesis protein A
MIAAKPASIILCGGTTRRFGGNKANASVGGRQVIERIFKVLEPLSSRIIAVTSGENTDVRIPDGAVVVVDIYPGRGPLGGIYTGLLHAHSDFALVVGCDMPFLNAGLISFMFSLADGFDAVAPRIGGRYIEPLHTVYTRACLARIESQLKSGQQSIWPVLRELNTRYMEKKEYLPLDPRLLSFFNINVPEDLERANRIAAQLDTDIV